MSIVYSGMDAVYGSVYLKGLKQASKQASKEGHRHEGKTVLTIFFVSAWAKLAILNE